MARLGPPTTLSQRLDSEYYCGIISMQRDLEVEKDRVRYFSSKYQTAADELADLKIKHEAVSKKVTKPSFYSPHISVLLVFWALNFVLIINNTMPSTPNSRKRSRHRSHRARHRLATLSSCRHWRHRSLPP